MKRTAINRFNPATGPKWMNRGGPLAKVSAAKSIANRAQQAAYRIVEAGPQWCFACGKSGGVIDHSHTLTQKAYPQHAANPANIVLEHRHGCHSVWENNKQEYARLYPEAFAAKLAVMQALEPNYYAVFMLKNPWAAA